MKILSYYRFMEQHPEMSGGKNLSGSGKAKSQAGPGNKTDKQKKMQSEAVRLILPARQ